MKNTRLLFCALMSGLTGISLPSYASAPYVGLNGHYFLADPARNSNDGSGIGLLAGWPLQSHPALSVETHLNGTFINDSTPGALNQQFGAGLDLRALLSQNRFVTPFVLAGVGVTQTNLPQDDHPDAFFNAGLGALMPLGETAFSMRAEARAIGIVDSETTADEFVNDYRVSLGIEYRFAAKTEMAAEPAAPEAAPTEPPAATPEPVVVDSDGDTVSDASDECPDSAPGVSVDSKGCLFVAPAPPADSDGDAVPNDADKCPDTAQGAAVDAEGCALDTDGDGVPNAQDACAGTAAGLKVDAKGCVVTQTLVLSSILFAAASADLLEVSKAILDGIATSLQAQPSVRVLIIGHTDALGTQAANLTLSQQRAETVRGYLIGRGVNGEQLSAEGYGEFNPVASNDKEEGRAKNRRVEFRLVSQP